MSCIYCKHPKIYQLQNGYIKCASCKKKYSLKKLERKKQLLHAFFENLTAKQAAQNLKLNYVTVSRYYKAFRVEILSYLDKVYEKRNVQLSEYDEYIYSNTKDLDKAHNILTFNYDGFIYNLLLPTTRNFDYEDRKALEHFIRQYRMRKLQHSNSMINEFWEFLEESLKPYKGVEHENFILYLKEIEFKFNYRFKNKEQILYKHLGFL